MKRNDISIFSVVITLYLVSVIQLSAATGYYFYVQFSDKNNSPYSLSNSSVYLSQRALDRRAAFGVAVDSLDMPVNPSYVQELTNKGMNIHCKSKWLNGVTVLIPDSNSISQIINLPFVKYVQYTGKIDYPNSVSSSKVKALDANLYGTAYNQINQISGTYLHSNGYKAKGIHIAVIDAGFLNVDSNPAFDSLRLQNRLLGVKDIIQPESNIFAQDSHGANVLSIMAGNIAGKYLGTAPEASYWLIRTEYSPSEYLVEADFWVAGIEFADSVGVDLVNSSLGYYTFDDPTTSFSYADMNGKTSRASISATIASKKGIVVVVSAGNEGDKAWRYIGSPADADGILTVGAVTSDGFSSAFSSFGPSSDNRIKPEICALGSSTTLVNSAGIINNGNGTSYSTPVVAGVMACLLQRYKTYDSNPDVNVLLKSVASSASLYNNPTAQLGYGIPDFWKAELNLPVFDSITKTDDSNFRFAYNKAKKTVTIFFRNPVVLKNSFVTVYSIVGSKVIQNPLIESFVELNLDQLNSGIYCVSISQNGFLYTRKILVQ